MDAKVEERRRARELRAQGWTMVEIARELGVSKSSVSVWTADVEFDDSAWLARVEARRANAAGAGRPRSTLALRREQEIEQARVDGITRVGTLTEHEFLIAGLMLYAGEGFKNEGALGLANTDPRLVVFFLRWLRHFFDIDEARLRVRLYLHEGLDLDAANAFWSEMTGIPTAQFNKPYRAAADGSRRKAKHPMGCPSVVYCCSHAHRRVMGMINALLCCEALPG